MRTVGLGLDVRGQDGVSWFWQGSHTHNIGWVSGSSPVLLSLDPWHCHQTYLLKTKTQAWPVGVEGPVFLLSHISSLISECLLLLSDQTVSSWAQDQCCFGSLPQDWHSCSRNPHDLQSLKYSLWLFMEKVGFYGWRQQLRSVPSRSQDYGIPGLSPGTRLQRAKKRWKS